MVPFYLKHAPRLQAITPIRVEKVLHTVKIEEYVSRT